MTAADRLVAEYLDELDHELRDLPRAERREVADEIAEHIDEARAQLAEPTEAEMRNLLERVGAPADIAAEARERFGVRPARRGWLEVVALVLLLVGGLIVPVVGWIAGVVLLWLSNVWGRRDKLIGTLVLPGGLLFPFALYAMPFASYAETCVGTTDLATGEFEERCTGGPPAFLEIAGPVLLLVVVFAPIATTIYLTRRMNRAGAVA